MLDKLITQLRNTGDLKIGDVLALYGSGQLNAAQRRVLLNYTMYDCNASSLLTNLKYTGESKELQPLEEWVEDNETMVITKLRCFGHDIEEDITIVDLCKYVRLNQSMFDLSGVQL